MSRWRQQSLLLIYVATLAVLVWQRAYNAAQLLGGTVLIGQGAWALWRHSTRREVAGTKRVVWGGWINLACGIMFVGLALGHLDNQQQVATEPKIMCGGKEWRGSGRPPDECGLDALRPMPLGQPARDQRAL